MFEQTISDEVDIGDVEKQIEAAVANHQPSLLLDVKDENARRNG